jgi:hypothetical protein
MVVQTSPSMVPLGGLSVLLEPAYVEPCLSKDVYPTNYICKSSAAPNELEKIELDLVHPISVFDVEQSQDFYSSGMILKAAAASHFSKFPIAQPYCTYTQAAQTVEPQSKPYRRRRMKRHAVLLIATQLSELQSEDPDKVIIVRKINRLGFESADILTEHFSQFGHVNKVLLSNAHNKMSDASHQVRLRPSGIGFLVFDTPEAAARVLAEGQTQIINGVEVVVRAFERRQVDSSDEMVGQDVDETCSIATASTRCSMGSYDSREEENNGCREN